MSYVEPSSKPIQQLLKDIHSGKIRLPDLQRDFKWKRTRVKALLDTVQRSHPTGSLLFLKTSREGPPPFGSTGFKYAPAPNVTDPEYLVLDGQQRLTSCYLALYNGGTGKYDFSYFVDLRELFRLHAGRIGTDEIEFESCIVTRPWDSNPAQFLLSHGLLPISLLRESEDPNSKRSMLKDALKVYKNALRGSEPDSPYFNDFIDADLVEGYLDSFFTYQFPVIELPDTLSVSAVCQIFESINSRGLKLGAFDLAVATLKAQGENLKARWLAASEVPEVKALDKDGTNVLQTIALLAGRPSKKAGLPSSLKAADLKAHWDDAVEGLTLASQFLAKYGATDPHPRTDFLPYDGIIPSLAAVLHRVHGKGLSEVSFQRASKIVLRWYYTAALGQRYNEGTDVVQATDFREIVAYAVGASSELPSGLNAQPWGVSVWTNAGPSNGAIGKALKCLLNHQSPKDPLTLGPVGSGASRSASQLHHIFPRGMMKGRLDGGAKNRRLNSIVNQTFLTDKTNRIIGDKPPSKYLPDLIKEMAKDGGTPEQAEKDLREILKGHLVNDAAFKALQADDFDSFLELRAKEFARVVQSQFGVSLTEIENAVAEEEALAQMEDAEDEGSEDENIVELAETGDSYKAAG